MRLYRLNNVGRNVDGGWDGNAVDILLLCGCLDAYTPIVQYSYAMRSYYVLRSIWTHCSLYGPYMTSNRD